MNASSSKKVNKDEQVAQCKVHKPKWLESFLRKTFFDLCTAHPYRRNEFNKYCINCNLPVCQYCVASTHRHHKILKIYRHVYKDVVSLSAMEKYIDCSQIQPFKCNKRLVISLNPLPHSGSAINNEASACNTCSRKLTDPDSYRYCSISCKVKGFLTKANDSVPPFISIRSPPPQEEQDEPAEPPKLSLRKYPRKGTPSRAPFF
ncbi:hypothetical protein RJT34_11509 [Clitoria ternatea]|uniref:B box-type domain-containing protein n=1 Tax=Clitoria ternatea TaxID=43366 RepID=A0AAN9JM70_CLITE